jgi:hypothetical protein
MDSPFFKKKLPMKVVFLTYDVLAMARPVLAAICVAA